MCVKLARYYCNVQSLTHQVGYLRHRLPAVGLAVSDYFVNKCLELSLGKRTHFCCLYLAVLENHKRGNASNAVLLRCLVVAVDIHFGYFQATTILIGNFFNDWTNHFARSTPFCPIIHKYGPVSLQNFLCKAGVCYVGYFVAQGIPPGFAVHLHWYMGGSAVNMIGVRGPKCSTQEAKVRISA